MTAHSPAAASAMAREIAEVPDVLARQADAVFPAIAAIAAAIRRRDPPLFVTIARGSSDHAALYLKYLLEILLGLPCASIGPSVASVYRTPLRLAAAVAVTISQSGRSPDLIALQAAAKNGGALTLALVNDTDSPVARAADHCIPLSAGPETSVAATKSMVAALSAGAALVAALADERPLAEALRALPGRLAPDPAPPESIVADLARIGSAFVIGRGATLAAAAEAALKLKETSAIHAEAFSSAEVLHGPAGIITPGFPVLALMAQDAAREGMLATNGRLAAMGARLYGFDIGPQDGDMIGVPDPGHPLLAPIPMLQSFYALAERVARRRGRDPDAPPHLKKVTETL